MTPNPAAPWMSALRTALVAGLLLTVSACLPSSRPDIPWDVLQTRYASDDSRFLDLGGGLIVHYRDQGDPHAPAVVLVHGFSASLHAWEPWVRRLPDYRVISLDLPGRRLTRAPPGYRASTDGYADLIALVTDRIGVHRYVVVGNSMGGATAWTLALHHPEQLRGLVLVDAAGWPGPHRREGPPALLGGLLRSSLGRSLARTADPEPLARQGLPRAYVDPALVTPDLVARYSELARAPGHREILITIDSRPAEPVTPTTFAAIQIPTLVMHGEADALIPVADGRAFAAAIPRARLVTYPGVGHVPMEQIPDQSAGDLRVFLQSLAP